MSLDGSGRGGSLYGSSGALGMPVLGSLTRTARVTCLTFFSFGFFIRRGGGHFSGKVLFWKALSGKGGMFFTRCRSLSGNGGASGSSSYSVSSEDDSSCFYSTCYSDAIGYYSI